MDASAAGDRSAPLSPEANAERLRQLIEGQAEVLELIATRAPISRTIDEICRLLEATIGPSECAVLAADDDRGELRWMGRSALPAGIAEVVAERAAKELERLSASGDHPDRLEMPDPEQETHLIWLVPIVGLSGRPLGALCVRRPAPNRDDGAEAVIHQAAGLTHVALEQHFSMQYLTNMITAEREALAGDLHDDPIQAVTTVNLILQRLLRTATPEQADLFAQATEMLSRANERMRRMLFELHPAALEDDGLVVALEIYCEETLEIERIGWKIDHDVVVKPSVDTAKLAFRLAHEALANAAAHSGTDMVDINLSSVDDGLSIQIVDYGIGFDPESIPHHRPGHLGFRSAQQLARRVGGRFDIESSAGAGCTVDIWLPQR